MKKAIVILATAVFAFSACGSDESGSNGTSANQPETKNFNSQPVDNSGKPVPGIPDPNKANITNVAPGGSPTPGIPEPGKADVTNSNPNGTPTPGIPDEATRKKMIEELKKNPDAVNTAPKEGAPKPGEPSGPLNRPRKAPGQ
ncbi:MAG: hypothetical protein R2684_16645 [Pyrinomonadaceae bacterium]